MLKAFEEDQTEQKDNTNNEVHFGEEFNDNVLCVDKCKGKDWVLDSDINFHVWNQKEAFVDYKEDKIKMESVDNSDVHVKDIWSIKLKMHARMMVKLIGVKYIPILKRIYFNRTIEM